MSNDTRNATLKDLADLLTTQQARKLDLVVPAGKLRSVDGLLVVEGAEPIIDDDGVTAADGTYRPTSICDEGISEKLGIPLQYLRKIRETRPDLYDANVNGWLHGTPDTLPDDEDGKVRFVPGSGSDPRSFLLRTFRGDNGGEGVARALLSSKYRCIDNLDVLTAALEGVKDAGVDVDIHSCDLTERRMYVNVIAPQVTALAPELLKGYRSPFGEGGVARSSTAPNGYWHQERAQRFAELGDRYGWSGDKPIVFAGFQIGNSEVGGGMWTIVPKITLLTCWNGLTITKDALTQVHIGGKLEDGIIRYSDDTQRKSIELVRAQTRDAVATFLDTEYLSGVIAGIEEKAGTPIKGDVSEAVRTVCKTLKFSEEHTAGVLDHFIRGGQVTAGGVVNAITSFAQLVPDADTAAEMEAGSLRALELAAA